MNADQAVRVRAIADTYRAAVHMVPARWQGAFMVAIDEAEQAVLDRGAKLAGAHPSRADRLEALAAGGDEVAEVIR